MDYRAISFAEKFGLFDEQWQPKVIAELNDYQFKVVRLEGDLFGILIRIPTRHLS